jgi:hypothetical protein
MTNNESFYKALKMSWLHILLHPFNHSPWKVLLLGSIQKWGGSNILYLSKEGLDKIAEKVNLFWKDVFLNLSEFLFSDIKSFTKKTPFSQHILFIHILPPIFIKGFNHMDWLKHVDYPLTPPFPIGLNFIEYFSILSAIPHRWKLLIRGIGKLNLIENDIADKLKRDPKPCKYFSKQYMLNVKMLPLNITTYFYQGI